MVVDAIMLLQLHAVAQHVTVTVTVTMTVT
jgi:hypothetical protein